MGSKDLKSVSASCRSEIGKGIKKLKGMFGSIRLPQAPRPEKYRLEERSLLDDVPAGYAEQSEMKRTARVTRQSGLGVRMDAASGDAAHAGSASAEDVRKHQTARYDPIFRDLDGEDLDVTDLMQQECEDHEDPCGQPAACGACAGPAERETPASVAAETIRGHVPRASHTGADEVEYCDFLPPMSRGERRAPGTRTAGPEAICVTNVSPSGTARENKVPAQDAAVPKADETLYLEICESEIFESELFGSAENVPLMYLEINESEVFESEPGFAENAVPMYPGIDETAIVDDADTPLPYLEIDGSAVFESECVIPLYLEIDESEVFESEPGFAENAVPMYPGIDETAIVDDADDLTLPYSEICGSEVFGSAECTETAADISEAAPETDLPEVLAQAHEMNTVPEGDMPLITADAVRGTDFTEYVSVDRAYAEECYVPNFVLVCDDGECEDGSSECGSVFGYGQGDAADPCGGARAEEHLDTMLPDDAVRQFDTEDRITPPELDIGIYDECEDNEYIFVEVTDRSQPRISSGIAFDFVSPASNGSALNFTWGCAETKTKAERTEETPIAATL